MATLNTIVYSIQAAQRILNLKSGVFKVQEWAWVVLVVGKNFSRFMSKKLFKKHFVDHKKEQSKTIQIIQNSRSQFAAKSNDKIYQLEATRNAVTCNCKDYTNQLSIIKQACCKHGYAVLNTLGFDSLSSYLSSKIDSQDLGFVTNHRLTSEPRKIGRSVD
jgi:hypothetical protein